MKLNRLVLLIMVSILTATVAVAGKKEGFKKGIHTYAYADGRIYAGNWEKYEPSGFGVMTLPDGSTIEGTFVSGRPYGKMECQSATGAVFTGTVTPDYVWQTGTVVNKNGNTAVYTSIVNGEISGDIRAVEETDGGDINYLLVQNELGDLLCKSVTLADGIKFVFDVPCASEDVEVAGTIFYNGAKYVGGIKNRMRHGKGREVWDDGSIFEGEFRDGEEWAGQRSNYIDLNGNIQNVSMKDKQIVEGSMKYKDGGTFVGTFWQGNEWNGTATNMPFYKSEEPGVLHGLYTGKIVDGVKSGKGKYIERHDEFDGDVYEGNFANGSFNGQGTYTWRDGSTYTGQWKNDNRSGQGTFVGYDGTKYVGQWANDKYNGQGTLIYAPGQPWIRATGTFIDGQHRKGTLVRTNGIFTGMWDEEGNKIR